MIVQTACRLPARSTVTLTAALAALALLVAHATPTDCQAGERRRSDRTRSTEPEQQGDILFLIDNSNSMSQAESLKLYFPNFIHRSRNCPPSRPAPRRHHVDLAPGSSAPSCSTIGGSRACSRTRPGADLHDGHSQHGRPLLDLRPDASAARRSLTGDIADAFACYASVGTAAAASSTSSPRCAPRSTLRHHLQAAANVNFMRKTPPRVIILTDEDDCSAPTNSTLFDPTQTTLASELGAHSYRCSSRQPVRRRRSGPQPGAARTACRQLPA